jgi:hypothetical protein
MISFRLDSYTSSKRTSTSFKPSNTASSSKKRVVPDSSESEPEPSPSKPKPKPKAAPPAKKPPAKKQKVVEEDSSSGSEGIQSKKARARESEKDAKEAKAKPAAKGKAPAKKPAARKKKGEEDDIDDFVVEVSRSGFSCSDPVWSDPS